MSLSRSFKKQGDFLFKYRGQFPVLLFFLSLPFVSSIDYSSFALVHKQILMIVSILFAFAGFLVRFYTVGTTTKGTSGRNTKKQVAKILNTSGVYSLLRNPLYFGNFLIWIGITISTFSIYFIIVVSLLFWLYYERIIFTEEYFLENKFGDKYVEWSNNTPVFFPNFSNFISSNTQFSVISVLRREYASVLSAVIGFIYIDLLKNYFITGTFMLNEFALQILVFTLIVTFIFRTLKHYTNLLNEDGRS